MRGSPKQQKLAAAAERHLQCGAYAKAAELLTTLLKSNPRDVNLLAAMGHAESKLGRHASAARRLQQAIKLQPRLARLHEQLARVYRGDQNLERAMQALNRALQIEEDRESALVLKAHLLRLKGEYEQVYELLRPLIERGSTDPAASVIFGQVCWRYEGIDRGIEVLRCVTEDDSVQPIQRVKAMYRLARLLERAERYDEAMQVVGEASAQSGRSFDPDAHDEQIDRIIEGWSAESLATLPRSREQSELPIFIVGMPRSGTSLTEQILSCHSQVYGAGEREYLRPRIIELFRAGEGDVVRTMESGRLNTGALDRAARGYLRDMQRLDRSAARITDKMWNNFLYVGPINLMFPRAKVIHCVRSPMDTCVSCYMLDFSQGHDYSYDLAHIGLFYRSYRRLMAHWHDVLDLPVFEVKYEDMVANQESMTRELLEFLGLPWEDACLRFYESDRPTMTLSTEQVRTPMYNSSVHRYRKYEAHLGQLREVLGPLASE